MVRTTLLSGRVLLGEKDPKPSQQHTTHPLIGSLSARKLDDRQHLSTEMNEATTNSSTWEKAFASGQSFIILQFKDRNLYQEMRSILSWVQ